MQVCLRTSERGSWHKSTCTAPEEAVRTPAQTVYAATCFHNQCEGWTPVPAKKIFPTWDPLWYKMEP